MIGGHKKKIHDLSVIVSDHQSANELITKELYKKNLELAHTNRMLSLLRSIDELVLEASTGIVELADGVARAVVSSSTYAFCGVFVKDGQLAETLLRLKGYAEVESAVSPKLSRELSGISMQADGVPFSDAKSIVLPAESLDLMLRDQVFGMHGHIMQHVARETGAKSFCMVKLLARQQIVGVLLVGMLEQPDVVSPDEQALLERLSEAVGVAIDNKLLSEENKRVLKKLKLSNDKLKALDQAKDEFISMASHQLRTPLTSVKGYLSMLAEGDAGELNETQSRFVDQAFISSQRMVYLIADLLNVSRLKTGKFVIEAKPMYLPDVVESEIAQLTETVKARGLTMVFDKPATFPVLLLDEIKIRQVIMNFADNAIYYTPKGKITIKLTQTAKSVEFSVTDTGIGVPKVEQHHLFTKFYRAGNARKSRPDGTGLGLYMAKKVIVAQGGALLFKTQEGKGSTFGFTFSKDKLKVPDQKNSA